MAVTFVNAGTNGLNTATLSVTWPTGRAADDVAYLFWTFSSNLDPADMTGWTRVASNDGAGSNRARILRRVLDGSETGSLATTTMTQNRQSACLVIYRGVDTTTPEDSTPAVDTTGVTGTTHTNPTETIVNAGAVVVTSIHERATSIDTDWTAPSGYTERADSTTLATGSGGTITAVADLLTPQSAGAAVTPPVWTGNHATGTAQVITYTLALKAAAAPAAPPPPPPYRRIQHLLVR